MLSDRKPRFTPEADHDLASILQYTVETWDDWQMDVYAAHITDVVNDLASFPGMGRRRDEISLGLLSYPVGQHVIFYQATADELIVRRILHHRQDIPSNLVR